MSADFRSAQCRSADCQWTPCSWFLESWYFIMLRKLSGNLKWFNQSMLQHDSKMTNQPCPKSFCWWIQLYTLSDTFSVVLKQVALVKCNWYIPGRLHVMDLKITSSLLSQIRGLGAVFWLIKVSAIWTRGAESSTISRAKKSPQMKKKVD